MCTPGTPIDADDDNPCTADGCDPVNGAFHDPVAAGTSCETDGNACDGTSVCDGAGACQPGTPPVLDDQNPCTADACDPVAGVTHTPVAVGTSCSDANACNGDEVCNAFGACLGGPAPVLDDGNPCTVDACDPMLGVTHTPAATGTSCANGAVCDGAETCDGAGTCQPGTPLPTDDGNPCTVDSCDPTAGVVHAPAANGTSCADTDLCNGSETCQAAACVAGTPASTDDGNPCTVDTCDPIAGVVHAPVANGTSCADADLCNGSETCQAGACTPGTPLTTDDGNACTADICDPATGVVTHPAAPVGTPCTLDACLTNAACNDQGICAPNGPPSADDGDPCTLEFCDPVTGLVRKSCEPLDRTISSNIFASMDWLLTGSPPVQEGVAAGTIDPRRASVVTGELTDRDLNPLGNVVITIADHPEFGFTRTRSDGRFDMLVNGGSQLAVQFQAESFIQASRTIFVPWNEYVRVPQVALVQLDLAVTQIDLNSAEDFQVAQGSTVTDGDGDRQATLLFPAGITAELIMPDGSVQAVTDLRVRATEFTVGPTGPQAMPAALPPTSSYTYAVELTADEDIRQRVELPDQARDFFLGAVLGTEQDLFSSARWGPSIKRPVRWSSPAEIASKRAGKRRTRRAAATRRNASSSEKRSS
jgi:hypothetical protein